MLIVKIPWILGKEEVENSVTFSDTVNAGVESQLNWHMLWLTVLCLRQNIFLMISPSVPSKLIYDQTTQDSVKV